MGVPCRIAEIKMEQARLQWRSARPVGARLSPLVDETPPREYTGLRSGALAFTRHAVPRGYASAVQT
jgi:hypothetical protein